ncbi:MAG: succinate dehydrogenase, cytochrome b556 subunit [Gammaproteobacteria bacterium]|nr:succinate dehydrogenase, cytochrome b556 subunit [Gammaproteobacteria bacterium]
MADAAMKKKRPVYLDLVRIRLPLPGFVSILHRASGLLLFVLAFWLLALLDRSLASPEGYAQVRDTIAHPLAKLVLIGIGWAFFHHFCAGIRYLLIDMHVGVDLATARASSWAVLGASIVLTLVFGAWIW